MLQALNDFIAEAMDYVLGWVLYLPRDVRLFTVAVMTSAVLTFVRLWTTNQEWLRRSAADRKRLAELIKQARRDKDKPARRRYRQTVTLIKFKGLRFEGKPLLAAILPVLLLAMWAFSRLGFEPPAPGEVIEVRMFVPGSAIGEFAHMVSQDGLEAVDGWVQEVVEDEPMKYQGWWDKFFNGHIGSNLPWMASPTLGGVAKWQAKAAGDRRRFVLKIRHGGRTYEKELLVGSRKYAPPVEFYDAGAVQAIELAMRQVRLFGQIGGLDFLFLAPWLVAYLIIAIGFVTVLKRVFRIH